MANKLIVVDKDGDPWGKINVVVMWNGGGQDKVWVDETGSGTFGGSGTIDNIVAPGDILDHSPSKMDGNSTCKAKSRKSH